MRAVHAIVTAIIVACLGRWLPALPIRLSGEKLLKAALHAMPRTRNVGEDTQWARRVAGNRRQDGQLGSSAAHGRRARYPGRFSDSAYGPGSEPMVTRGLPPGAPLTSSDSAALPPGPGADQVRAYCTMCHDLGMVVATRRSAAEWNRTTLAMLAKTGAPVSAADARTIARYLEQHFGLSSSPEP